MKTALCAFLSVLTLSLASPSVIAEGKDSPITTGVPAGFESASVTVNGVKIHYVIGGHGPAIVLLHGWPETWYEWRHMLPLFAENFTVVAPDLRGMGDSSLEATGYDKKTLAQDIHALVVHLKLTKPVIVGHDWGAPVAYAYAAQYRNEVERLIMVEGLTFGPWLKNTNLAWFFNFFRIPGYAEALLPGREPVFLKYFYEAKEYHVLPEAFPPEAVEVYIRSYARPDRMHATYELYRSIDQDVQDNAQFSRVPLTIPVLAVAAEKGAGAELLNSISKLTTSSTAVVFKQTGHFIPEERPQDLAQIIKQFIAGQPVPTEWSPSH